MWGGGEREGYGGGGIGGCKEKDNLGLVGGLWDKEWGSGTRIGDLVHMYYIYLCIITQEHMKYIYIWNACIIYIYSSLH